MKKIKSIIAAVLVSVMAFSLTGCGEVKKAETTVNDMFAAFKSGDMEKAANYTNVDEIESMEDKNNTLTDDEALKIMLGKVEYKIISSEKVDNITVKVKTEITAIDMKPVL